MKLSNSLPIFVDILPGICYDYLGWSILAGQNSNLEEMSMRFSSLWKRLGVFLLSTMLLAGLCMTAYAAGVMSSAPVMRWGQIRSVDSDGAYHVEDSLGEFTVRVPEASFVDAQTGAAYDAGKVRQGDVIKIWFDSDLYDGTSSEPDVNALVVVTNFKDDNVYSGPEYYETLGHATEDTSLHVSEIQVINGEEDKSIKFVGTTKIFAYGTNEVVRVKDIQPGSRLMVWKDNHGAIVRIIVLPYNYNAAISWNVDSGVCSINGEDVGTKIEIVSEKVAGGSLDQVYLPLKAVSSKFSAET